MEALHSRFTYHHSQPASDLTLSSRNGHSSSSVFDLNHILLFIACVSPLFLLSQTWRQGGMNRGWRLTALAVLVIAGSAWILKPEIAGFIGGGVWFVLLLVPLFGLRMAARLVTQQRYAAAWRLVRALRFLHPGDGLLERSRLVQALDFAQGGDFTSALAYLEPLRNNQTNVGRQATAQTFRIRGDWNGLLAWRAGELPPEILVTDFALQPIYLRALGEAGTRDKLLLEFTRHAGSMTAAAEEIGLYDLSLLPVLAFGGRLRALSNLLETKLRKLPRDTKEFWIGTSELAAGEVKAGRARLENLHAATGDGLIRAEAASRLERANEIAPAPLSPAAATLLRRIEQSGRPSSHVFASGWARPTTAVVLLIALNIAMFVAECGLGGSTSSLTLHRLGALEFFAVRFEGEYWRLFTSLFLHFGALHLIFNLYALFIIGSGLERSIGSIRFAICYLLSGLGSGVGVLFLRQLGWNKAEQLVGASGCVMGLVGVWAGLLLRHRDGPMAGRRLKNILLIVVVQTAFDLSTPQISMAAHLSGLITGLMLGLILAPRHLNA
jgi:rhomboid protease GluP